MVATSAPSTTVTAISAEKNQESYTQLARPARTSVEATDP